MNERLLRVARRIRDEFAELARVIERTREGWRRAQRSADDFYLDSVALNLRDVLCQLKQTASRDRG